MTETSCCAELTSEDRWNIVLQWEFLNMSAVTTRRGDFLFLNRAVWNPANWLLRSVFLLFSAFCLFIHFALIPNPFVYYQAVFFFFFLLSLREYRLNDTMRWVSTHQGVTHWFLHKCRVWHHSYLGLLESDMTIFGWQGWLRYPDWIWLRKQTQLYHVFHAK